LSRRAIETARLLLHSKIANEFLGRYVNTHPLIVNAATFTRGEQRATYAQNTFYAGTAPVGKGPYQPSIFGAIVPKPETLKGIGNFRARIDFNNGTVNFNWEKFPERESTITLDTTTPDRLFGDPRAKVAISISDLDRKTLDEGLARVGKMLEEKKYAAKGSFKRTTEPILFPMEHLMGATRMSAGTGGVVGPWGTVKSIDNLYVASTSVFPTGDGQTRH
jgi:choline dehydrogenase-like flavoprotein